MKNFKPLAIAAAVASVSPLLAPYRSRKVYRDRPVKQCLQCGTPHQHNNDFCSGDCCRAYRALEFNCVSPSTGKE